MSKRFSKSGDSDKNIFIIFPDFRWNTLSYVNIIIFVFRAIRTKVSHYLKSRALKEEPEAFLASHYWSMRSQVKSLGRYRVWRFTGLHVPSPVPSLTSPPFWISPSHTLTWLAPYFKRHISGTMNLFVFLFLLLVPSTYSFLLSFLEGEWRLLLLSIRSFVSGTWALVVFCQFCEIFLPLYFIQDIVRSEIKCCC